MFSPGYPNIEDIEITMEINGVSIQLNITCISIGGPATNVTWTKNDYYEFQTVTEGTETVLNDRVTAQYTHTLTATETYSDDFFYSCEVSNHKPSSATVYVEIFTFTGYGMSIHI